MRIVVVGAGDVGTHIARDLADDHDVVVVDVDTERAERLESSLGVTAVAGDGRSLDTLESAGIHEAEVVIASTDDDAVNVMVGGAVENVTGAFTIARAKSVDLFETWQRFGDALGIDQLLCVDLLTAEAVVRTVTLPGALATSVFVDGKVEMAEFEVEAGNTIADKSVAKADEFPSLTFAGLLRTEKVLIPSGDTVIEPGDRVRRHRQSIECQALCDPPLAGGNTRSRERNHRGRRRRGRLPDRSTVRRARVRATTGRTRHRTRRGTRRTALEDDDR